MCAGMCSHTHRLPTKGFCTLLQHQAPALKGRRKLHVPEPQDLQLLSHGLTLTRCSFPPEPLLQMMRCLENRKQWRSPSFLMDRDPRRPLLVLLLSVTGTWTRQPVGTGGSSEEGLSLASDGMDDATFWPSLGGGGTATRGCGTR